MDKHENDKLLKLLKSKNKAKKRAAFDAIYQRFSDVILNYCFRIVSTKFIAEDILQETFIKFFEWVEEEKEIRNIGGLLFSIAYSICLKHINKLKETRSEDITTLEESYIDKELIEDVREPSFAAEKVAEAMAKLTPLEREIISLFYYGGYAQDEIAEFLNLSKNIVNAHAYRARQKMAKDLEVIRNKISKER